jgi:hypothetical protein
MDEGGSVERILCACHNKPCARESTAAEGLSRTLKPLANNRGLVVAAISNLH